MLSWRRALSQRLPITLEIQSLYTLQTDWQNVTLVYNGLKLLPWAQRVSKKRSKMLEVHAKNRGHCKYQRYENVHWWGWARRFVVCGRTGKYGNEQRHKKNSSCLLTSKRGLQKLVWGTLVWNSGDLRNNRETSSVRLSEYSTKILEWWESLVWFGFVGSYGRVAKVVETLWNQEDTRLLLAYLFSSLVGTILLVQ